MFIHVVYVLTDAQNPSREYLIVYSASRLTINYSSFFL
jgi:hypothetical protein